MKLQWLQHVPFEGLGCIEEWAADRDIETRCTRLFADDALPDGSDFDLLVIMGGPMGIYDHNTHPWLVDEKLFIKRTIEAGKPVLGICLGAQLIADVLGANVYAGPHKEIGWFPIKRHAEAPAIIPKHLTAFHWHGDTFDIPNGAIRLAQSEACKNQGFVFEERVVAVQFHLETTSESMEALIKNCGHERVDAPFIQTAEQIRDGAVHMAGINTAMNHLMQYMLSDAGVAFAER